MRYKVLAAAYIASFAYMSKLTLYSPVYILTPFFILLILILHRRSTFRFNLSGSAAFFTILLASIVVVKSDKYSTYINLCLGMALYIAIRSYIVSSKFEIQSLLKCVRQASMVASCMFALDTIWRLSNPGSGSEFIDGLLMQNGIGFYLYKFNSIMFNDSNTVAIALQCLIFLNVYLYSLDGKGRTQIAIGLILLVLTLSRAAIISTFILLIINHMKKYKIGILILLTISPILFIILFPSMMAIFSNDASNMVKIQILDYFTNYLANANIWEIIIGSGFDRSIEIFDVYSHILIITLIVEFGVLGTIAFFTFLISTAMESRGKTLFLIVPLMLTSMSYWFYLGSPFVFATIAIIGAISQIVRIQIYHAN